MPLVGCHTELLNIRCEFQCTVRSLVSGLHQGGVTQRSTKERPGRDPPVAWAVVEGALMARHVASGVLRLAAVPSDPAPGHPEGGPNIPTDWGPNW